MGKVYTPKEFPVPCEVYSRVVGYIRPVQQWNPGKVAEFVSRKTFDRAFKGITGEKAELKVTNEVKGNLSTVKRLD